MARPTDFREEYVDQAYKLCLLGAIDRDMADFFGVSVTTFRRWARRFPLLRDALKQGKAHADSIIAEKLFQRAKGYEHPEDKIFLHEGVPVIVPTTKHYPPDTTAAIFWLKNRQPDKWRDRKNVELSTDVILDLTGFDLDLIDDAESQ